jgi:hypothetical protein
VKYLGRWYFSAAVSGREEELQWFRMMDSGVYTMQTTAVPQTVLLNVDIRMYANTHTCTQAHTHTQSYTNI